jgi:uncharacterized protein (DUF2267 family)
MNYQEFISLVQTMAQSSSFEEAEMATRATLKTIQELIPADQAEILASELPSELGEFLRGQNTVSSLDFHLQEFIERASQKENIEPTTAAIHVRAVFAVLPTAISSGNFTNFHNYFPHDYEELFTI